MTKPRKRNEPGGDGNRSRARTESRSTSTKTKKWTAGHLTVVLLALAAFFLPRNAAGQMFTYERDRAPTMTALAGGFHVVDFRARGSDTLLAPVQFTHPAYGIHFSRPGFAAYFAYGTGAEGQGENMRDVRLLDASLMLWSGMDLYSDRRARLVLPLALHSGYRSVDEQRTAGIGSRSFDLTVFSIGSGLSLDGRLGERVAINARALPMFGLATRSFEGAAGTAVLFESDAAIHLLQLAGRVGLSAGYGFRAQRWNVEASPLGVRTGIREHFVGTQHAVRVGINW